MARALNRLLLTAIVMIGMAQFARGAHPPSEVIFPAQKLPIKFSHRQHLGFKLACDFCHETAESSTTASDNLVPPEDACTSCHKIDRDQPDKAGKPAARC